MSDETRRQLRIDADELTMHVKLAVTEALNCWRKERFADCPIMELKEAVWGKDGIHDTLRDVKTACESTKKNLEAHVATHKDSKSWIFSVVGAVIAGIIIALIGVLLK